jgi:hypothetical protein
VNDEALRGFADAALEYCRWVKAAPSEPRAEMLQAQRLLTALLHHVLQLPASDWQNLKPASDEAGTISGATEEHLKERHSLYSAATERFADLPVNVYWLIFDPLDEADLQPVAGTLGDDLADIYCDLVEGLEHFRVGDLDEALWEWRFGYDTHWGNHLFEALRVIHSYLNR